MDKRIKILHLEEEMAETERVRLSLEADNLSCEIVVVNHLEQFASVLDGADFDLILAGESLSLKALETIRDHYPSLPFILLANALEGGWDLDSLEDGVTDFVLKDRLEGLGQTIRRAIKCKEKELALWQAADLMGIEHEQFRILSHEYKSLLDAIPDRISLRTADFKLVWANKAATEAIVDGTDITGRFCYEAFHHKKVHCEGCPAIESFHTGKVATAVMTTLDKRIWEVRSLPIYEDGQSVSKVIEIARDISERRRLEHQYYQAQKLETIGTLASGIAHDFNNILTCISGYGQILSRKMSEDNPQRAYVDIILDAANRAANLTGELLHFSSRQSCEQTIIDLNGVINTARKFFSKAMSENIDIRIHFHPEALNIFANRNHLEQVLMNLAINANHAMNKLEKGVFTVTTSQVSLKEGETCCPAGEYALLTISDTGEGMDLKTQQRAFEPFFTTKEVGKGSGLGLAVAYGIVQQHNGEITLSSEKDNGTTFRIYLPLVTTESCAVSDSNPEIRLLGGSETILLAEDDSLVRAMAQSLLTDFGYCVMTAENGEEAVDLFTRHPEQFDLLIFDLVMPKMNGYEASLKIQKMRPGLKTLISSGYLPEAQGIKPVLGGDTFLIEKPYTPEVLLQKVRNILDMPC